MAYRRNSRSNYRGRSSARRSFRSAAGSRRRASQRRSVSRGAQTLRLVIETQPASGVSRQIAGVTEKMNPPARRAKH